MENEQVDATIVEDDVVEQDNIEQDEQGVISNEPQEEPETFPRAYVEKLRKEAGEARVKAKRADDLARALHEAQVAATGRLADPTDLPYDEGILNDPAALTAALDDLLARKPHLASRTPRGDIGQGVTRGADTVDLAAILRRGA